MQTGSLGDPPWNSLRSQPTNGLLTTRLHYRKREDSFCSHISFLCPITIASHHHLVADSVSFAVLTAVYSIHFSLLCSAVGEFFCHPCSQPPSDWGYVTGSDLFILEFLFSFYLVLIWDKLKFTFKVNILVVKGWKPTKPNMPWFVGFPHLGLASSVMKLPLF